MRGLDIAFDVRVQPDIAETYPETTAPADVAGYISCEKADVTIFMGIVAAAMLAMSVYMHVCHHEFSFEGGRKHQVVTGVCLTTTEKQRCFSVSTDVTFKNLKEEEIDYYIETYRPLDKAGAYGIQEWIGYIGVTALEGSYFNVMGLPVQRIWEELNRF